MNQNTVERLSAKSYPLVFYKTTGRSHAWPGPYYTSHRPPVPEVNATLEILKFFRSSLTRVSDHSLTALPLTFELEQNYPNPFNPMTNVEFQMPNGAHVKLSIFDILGREVAVLVNGRKNAGRYSVRWDAGRLASGIYFYTLQAGQHRATNKMILMK